MPSSTSMSPMLSQRAQDYVEVLQKPSDFAWKGELYHKEKNPSGIIKLATAENSLLTTELLKYFNANFELTPSHLKYRWTLLNGYERSVKQALPEYFNAHFKARMDILSNHCVHGDGIGSLLAQVIWALCEPGDGVLMATPYYDSYPRDIIYPAQANVIPAYIPSSVDPLSTESLPYLRAALENPENRIRVIVFCLDIQTLAGCNPSRVHVVAGPTKDFGSSGLKVGSLISQHNPDLLLLVERAIQALPMSSASDALFTRVLSDVSFCNWFLEENRRRLSKAFEIVGDWCTYHELPFVPASAGVFFVVDLAPLLGRVAGPGATAYEQTIAGFRAMQDAGVYIVPMTISADPIVTRYRMTFTLPPDTMLLALRRIENAFKLSHWEFRN
ncbi:hypothetical protein FRC07_012158 [Ceratobasidium sp. 392]|nr:hypothetical protein FRC07_012158 [Ceratobasidium sp. 392]